MSDASSCDSGVLAHGHIERARRVPCQLERAQDVEGSGPSVCGIAEMGTCDEATADLCHRQFLMAAERPGTRYLPSIVQRCALPLREWESG